MTCVSCATLSVEMCQDPLVSRQHIEMGSKWYPEQNGRPFNKEAMYCFKIVESATVSGFEFGFWAAHQNVFHLRIIYWNVVVHHSGLLSPLVWTMLGNHGSWR